MRENDQSYTSAYYGGYRFRAAFEVGKKTRRDYGAVLAELKFSKLVGERNVFDLGSDVSVRKKGLLKPPMDDFLDELKSKD